MRFQSLFVKALVTAPVRTVDNTLGTLGIQVLFNVLVKDNSITLVWAF